MIADKNHDTMPNSIHFNPGDGTTQYVSSGLPMIQNCIIIPFPNDTSKYYIFHESWDYFNWGQGGYPLHLAYSVVDMNLRGGNGDVSDKNHVVISDTLENGMLSAVKHANGRDWWIIVPIPKSSSCYTLLVDTEGVHDPFLTQMPNVLWDWNGFSGFAVFPPNGEKYIRMERDIQLHIWDFDRCNGTFSHHQYVWIDSLGIAGAGAFGGVVSANSQYLYVSKADTILQFDLRQADIAASREAAGIWDYSLNPIPTYFGAMNLAPDGKIYMPTGTEKMHVIHSPDSLGIAANVEQEAITLPTTSAGSLPHHPNYFLGPLVGSKCDTLLSNQLALISYQSVEVYPNPARGRLTVAATSIGQRGLCHFYNTIGQCVRSVELKEEKTEVFVGDLPEGVYIYRIVLANSQVVYGKFVIQR